MDSHNSSSVKICTSEDNVCQKPNTTNSEELDWSIEIEPECSDGMVGDISSASLSILDEAPSYESDFSGFLTEKEYSMDTGKHIPNDARPTKECFNCLGDHNLQECPEKKDFKKIAQNRQTFQGKKCFSRSSVRYHEEGENKYDDVKAGFFSESLRDALGLREKESPEFIYRMRVLGYPPGWLKNAEVNRSDVSLFDGTGVVFDHPDDEEGETDVNMVKYEPEKLISYPGFNVSLPRGFRDDHHYYNCPRIQDHHHRDQFEKFMLMNKAEKYKRKKLKPNHTPITCVADIQPAEMDVDNSECVQSSIEVNPPLPKALEENGSENQRNKEDGECSDNSNDSTKCGQENDEKVSIEESEDNSSSSMQQHSSSDNEKLFSTPTSNILRKRHHRSRSKGCALGIFIPESITPHKDLPTPEKWGVDVSDHILFENLPDSVGAWNKMKGIVKDVRTSMNKFNAENSDED